MTTPIPEPSTPGLTPELVALTSAVGHDTEIVERFVTDFLFLLDDRLRSIAADLDARDDLSATVTLLSLETTGAMLGASGLVAAAGSLRDAVNERARDRYAEKLAALSAAAEELRRRLSR